MLKKILVLLVLTLAILTNTSRAFSQEPAMFLAVLRSPDRGTVFYDKGKPYFGDWLAIKTDYNAELNKWSDLDDHLKKIKEQAGDKTVLLEMQVHGDQYLSVVVQRKFKAGTITYTSDASMGYLINHAESILGSNQIIILDTCYAPDIYFKTIRKNTYIFGKFIENCDHIPKVPIYSIRSNCTSWNNVVFLEYIYNCLVDFTDLREFEEHPPEPRQEGSKSVSSQVLKKLWLVLVEETY